MKKLVMLLILVCLVGGCSASDHFSDQKQVAMRCAKNWRAQGYNFDPNSMTSMQMFQKVMDIRRAKYWAEKGYVFDPNCMTRSEMAQKVKDITRAEYWKERGYTFDPHSMTAGEMDQKTRELDKVEYWKNLGYYYDPNLETVFVTACKRRELKSVGGLRGRGGYGYVLFNALSRPVSLPRSQTYRYSYLPTYSKPLIAENGSYYGQISETTGRPKTVYVRGYHRKDGTYVRSHYRSPPRR